MTFGEKLKQLRSDKNLTQPEVSEAMGIEQSYLSKLENDKSLPSNDVLNRILNVFDLKISDLVDGLAQGTKNQLTQIPDVAAYFNSRRHEIISNRKSWLLLSALLVSMGVAFIYAGERHLFFTDKVFQYMSRGVILEGESKELFQFPIRSVPQKMKLTHGGVGDFVAAVNARSDQIYLLSDSFRGNIFNVEVGGGSRTYTLTPSLITRIDPWQSKLVVFLGLLMGVFGLIGLGLERRLSSNK